MCLLAAALHYINNLVHKVGNPGYKMTGEIKQPHKQRQHYRTAQYRTKAEEYTAEKIKLINRKSVAVKIVK